MAEYHFIPFEKDVWQQPVIDKDLTSPPSGPSKGDRYLIISADSGSNWAGQEKNITYYDGTNWRFITATEGMHVWVKDENKVYVFNGTSWGIAY